MRLDHLLSKEMSKKMDLLFNYECSGKNNKKLPVAMRFGVTPVLIPNTMVKTLAADGTILETVWESRWLPDLKRKQFNYLYILG